MSELSNPLFDNERDFLERQKEEYKNALMGDVDSIKTQGQEIGKKVALAGGVLLAGYLVKRMVSGGDKKKDKKAAKKKEAAKLRDEDTAGIAVMPNAVEHEYAYASDRERQKNKKKQKDKSSSSSISKIVASQAAALLMMYISKKVSDHLNSISENDDIAATPPVEEFTVVETTEIIVPREDAV